MTKQEEIREGMWEFILEVRQYLCNTEFAPEPFTAPVDLEVLREMGKTQLKKMDSQGLMIKVEGELPDTLTIKKGAYPSVETVGCLSVEGEWVRKEADEAFEPLIEEKI